MSGTDGAGMAERLVEICAEQSADELRVLLLVAERLRIGQRRYGRFNLTTDCRNFEQESIEEVADALVYAACGLMRGRG